MKAAPTRLVAADIGGTNARFALATVTAEGAISLGAPVTLRTGDYASLDTAWEAFAERLGEPLPKAAAFALAGPVTGEAVRLTNNSWTIQTGSLDTQLGLDRCAVLNDFAATAHAAASAEDDQFVHLAGPDQPLPRTGTITVVGPGTGLGVAYFQRSDSGYHAQACEAGHIEFAPLDAIEDAILQRLRIRHRRVSVERVVSGPGISEIYTALAAVAKRAVRYPDDVAIWQAGSQGTDALARAAIQRFCELLGSVAGDFALAHGASGVVIAGGLGLGIRDTLLASGFAERFRFKGRYEKTMSGIPVRLFTHSQPGLLGAVAAFAREHLQ